MSASFSVSSTSQKSPPSIIPADSTTVSEIVLMTQVGVIRQDERWLDEGVDYFQVEGAKARK